MIHTQELDAGGPVVVGSQIEANEQLVQDGHKIRNFHGGG